MAAPVLLRQVAFVLLWGSASLSVSAQAPRPPAITNIVLQGPQKILHFTLYPAANEYKMFRADETANGFHEELNGVFNGHIWKSLSSSSDEIGFYRLRVTPLSEDALFAATLLNRLAYGPMPDELERVKAMGPRAFIEEQLAPEKISERIDFNAPLVPSGWQYFRATGTGSSSLLWIALTSPGEGYLDDVKLVSGTDLEAGKNLIRNGDFELPLSTNNWLISPNLAGSQRTTGISHSGTSSLHLVATAAGMSLASSIWQTNLPGIALNQRYSLGFWFLAATNSPAHVTVRLAGDGVAASSEQWAFRNNLALGTASLKELQGWCIVHAVRSKRQLLEVLTQFFDNHFTTFAPKSQDYLVGKVRADTEEIVATDFEYRERTKWRDVLLHPNGTFFDLLKISAESPAMVIYLDTATSKNGAANENYARELMELFTMGVDNGYDQQDIEEMSRAWTGWQVDKLPPGQEDNPLARSVSNTVTSPGYWGLRFRSNFHDLEAKTIFKGKTVAARFGPPYSGKSYQLNLPARQGDSGMQDGYDIISHLANLPHTQEYISVKLCRMFVHEHFVHGVYDYTSSELSPEAVLVRECMRAWETPGADGRKGNLRNMLNVIFNSPLFRSHAASQQKVKSPFRLVVSAVRALRAATPDGGFTSESNGFDLLDPLARLGMVLFYREQPDGWSEFGADWINSSLLIERMRFAQGRLKVGNRNADPVALLKLKLPPFKWTDPDAVADYFLSILFPAEGRANLELDRRAAIAFLNSADTSTTSSRFGTLAPNSISYETRVRGMVAGLMGLPRFQEQ